MVDEFNRKTEYQKSQNKEVDVAEEFAPSRYETGELIDEYIDETPELIEPEDLENPKSEFFSSEGGEGETEESKRSLKTLFTKNAAALLLVSAVLMAVVSALGISLSDTEEKIASDFEGLETIFDPTTEDDIDFTALDEYFAKIYTLMQEDDYIALSAYVQNSSDALTEALKNESVVMLGYSQQGVCLWENAEEEIATPIMKIFYQSDVESSVASDSETWLFGFYTVDDFIENQGSGRIATVHGEETAVLTGTFLGAGSAVAAIYEQFYVNAENGDFDVLRAVEGSIEGGHFTGDAKLFHYQLTDDMKEGARRIITLPTYATEYLALSENGTLRLSELTYLTEADGNLFDLFTDASNFYYFDTSDSQDIKICVNQILTTPVLNSISYSSYEMKNGETPEFFLLTNELNLWQ